MQLTLDSAILEKLFTHAASAANRVGHIGDTVDDDLAVGPLADHIDAIAHELGELLGKPPLIAARVPNARAAVASRVVKQSVITRGDAPKHVTPDDHDASTTTAAEEPASHARPLVGHIVALEAIGWHVVGLRPSCSGDEPTLWHVTIERHDEGASMTMVDADPEDALAELVRYAQADAA